MTDTDQTVTVARIDPMRTLPIAEVSRRTGLGERTINRYLAQDEANRTPGRQFPRPVIIGARKRLWREATIIRWMEAKERGEQ